MNIHDAVVTGNINRVRQLLNKKNQRDGTGATPLLYAVFHSRGPIVRLLINAGANTNIRMPNGTSAVKIAMEYGQRNTVRNLILAGANTRGYNLSGYSRAMRETVQKAVENRKKNVQQILVRKVMSGELTPNQYKSLFKNYGI